MAQKRLAVSELKKLIEAVELGRMGVVQIGATIFDSQFAAAPSMGGVRAKIGLFAKARYRGGLLPWSPGRRRKSRIVHANNLRIQTECVHRTVGFRREVISAAEYRGTVVIGIPRVRCGGNARRLGINRCAKAVLSGVASVQIESVPAAYYRRRFVSGFLLSPRARIRLVLRRSEAGRQQSQEKNSWSQPAYSLV